MDLFFFMSSTKHNADILGIWFLVFVLVKTLLVFVVLVLSFLFEAIIVIRSIIYT